MLRIRRAKATVAAILVWLLSTNMVLASGPDGDGFDREGNLPFLFAVYIVTWATFFGYAFYMNRRQRELRAEMEELKRTLEGKAPQ